MITAEELAKEIRKHHKFWPMMTDEAQARIIIDFIQSRAAGVQGAGSVDTELAMEGLHYFWLSGDEGDRAYVDAIRRLIATPQPPKDAGAVPMPEPEPLGVGNFMKAGAVQSCEITGYTREQMAEYGDAREAAARDDAGRADAVPDVSEDDAAIANEVRAMQGALRNTDKPASYAAALFLACNAAKCNAGTLAVELTGVTDGDAEKGDWTVTVTRSNPSPAHAGAGAEALIREWGSEAANLERAGVNAPYYDKGKASGFRQCADNLRDAVRRLAGGDHA